MSEKDHTLKSKQRSNIFHAYRVRGHRNNGLYLVYSVKANRDFVLSSDRQFVHWMHYLETNQNVKCFDLTPDAIISVDQNEAKSTELDAVVENIDGSIEWHEVKSGDREIVPGKSQLQAQAAAQNEGVRYVTYSDKDLKPHAIESLRWLKAIAFASVLRGQEQIQSTLSLLPILQSNQVGTVRDILFEMNEYDPAVIQGLVVRFAIQGHIELDLNKRSFGLNTNWHWRGGQNVV